MHAPPVEHEREGARGQAWRSGVGHQEHHRASLITAPPLRLRHGARRDVQPYGPLEPFRQVKSNDAITTPHIERPTSRNMHNTKYPFELRRRIGRKPFGVAVEDLRP